MIRARSRIKSAGYYMHEEKKLKIFFVFVFIYRINFALSQVRNSVISLLRSFSHYNYTIHVDKASNVNFRVRVQKVHEDDCNGIFYEWRFVKMILPTGLFEIISFLEKLELVYPEGIFELQ